MTKMWVCGVQLVIGEYWGAHIFYDMVNLEHYVNSIWIPTEEEKQYLYFQQGNSTVHTSQHPMEALGERVISKELWSPCLPDLSACNFHVWENLKRKVYRNNSCNQGAPTMKL
jgi:hypothetical protein